MQAEFYLPGTTVLGYCSVSRSSQLETKLAGLNENSRHHAVGDFAGSRNIAMPSEGAKRRYQAHFVSKLTDCDGENSETDSSLDFAKDCGYITQTQHDEMVAVAREIGSMLGSMINNPGPFLISDL
jgi:hypothetical protein